MGIVAICCWGSLVVLVLHDRCVDLRDRSVGVDIKELSEDEESWFNSFFVSQSLLWF